MAATPRSDRAWAATRKGLFELQRTGDAGWRVGRASFLGDPVTMLLPPGGDGGTLLAALNLGHFGVKLHASDDGGASWHETAVPTYPEQPAAPAGADVAGAAGAAATAAPDVPWKLSLLWSLERDAAGTLWAGTIPGGLFRSGDGGVSWRLVESLWRRPERAEWMGGGYDAPGIHSICPHPGRPGELLIGISCGGAWTTRDDGASWALTASGMRADFMPPELAANPNIQDAHRIQRCADRPDVLWCQHHGGIWRSVDGAASWQAVTTAPLSSFGFAVAAHPRDPGSAWFVPAVADQQRVPVAAALAVNRTRDGGQSFETLRDGLPQRDCYDLVYRHGLALADDGESLLMGSTTGGLWASGDGGEHWQTVAANLPPIYAVRFG